MNKEQLEYFNRCTKGLNPCFKKYLENCVEQQMRIGIPFEKLEFLFDGTPIHKVKK